MATITLSPSQIAYVQQIKTNVIRETQGRSSASAEWGDTVLTNYSTSYSGQGDNFSSSTVVYPTADKTTTWGSWSTSDTFRSRFKTETIKNKRMLVQFDTSGVQGTITGATLRVYATSGGSTAASVDIYKATEAWSASTVTWNKLPSITKVLSDKSLPLTSWAAYDVSSALSGYGFVLYDDDYGNNQKLKEIPKTGSLAPQLLVTYTPYNSTIKSVTSSVKMDGSSTGTVTLERYNDSYTHTVKVSLGSKSQTFENVETSVSFTLPASWINQVPNATAGTATVKCWTYDTSGEQVGSASSATFSAVVPDSIVPSVSLTGEPVSENETVNGWGIYLQSYSKVKLTATGTAGTGATVSSYTFSGTGVSQSGTDSECTSNVLTASGAKTWKVTVTDSRGRTATASYTGTVHAYFSPTSSLEAYRCLSDGTRDDLTGTYGAAQGTYSFASCNGNNTATGVLKYGSTTVTESAESGETYQFGNGYLDVAKSYTVKLTVTDALGGSSTVTTVIQTTSGSLFIGMNNDRVSFGRPVSRAGLDCHFHAYFRGGLTLECEYPDIQCIASAGGHNAIYRGKALGAEVTSAQWAAIAAGTFDDLYIGDYWTIDGINYRIAAFDYYYKTGSTSCTTHHVVMVPDTNMYTHVMNDTDTTSGAYVGSKMYTEGLNTAKTTISDAFGSDHILTHRQYLHNATTSGYASAGSWYDSTVELMTEQNVYGCKAFGNSINGTTFPNNCIVDKSQYPLFIYRPDIISDQRAWFWLRDVASATLFCRVSDGGCADYLNASRDGGVRPSFSIC